MSATKLAGRIPSLIDFMGQRSFAGSPAHGGFVELREYTLHPRGIAPFLKLTTETADLRKRLLPFLGMFTCDIGGTLNRVVHFYHYTSWEERDAARQAAAKDSQWQNEYIKVARDYVAHQESSAYLPAGSVLDAAGSLPLQELAAKSGVGQDGPPGMYELRHYQLHPGYGSVPKLLEAFQKGIPHKIAADKDGTLAFFGYTDVGVLNSVIELWRYPSAAACIAARKAAREVTQWRETIGAVTPGVQHFRSAFLNPTAFSPLR